MKTAEQWQSEMVVGNTTGIQTIKDIQLDAWKQGMSDAAEIVNGMRGEGESDLRSVRDRIDQFYEEILGTRY